MKVIVKGLLVHMKQFLFISTQTHSYIYTVCITYARKDLVIPHLFCYLVICSIDQLPYFQISIYQSFLNLNSYNFYPLFSILFCVGILKTLFIFTVIQFHTYSTYTSIISPLTLYFSRECKLAFLIPLFKREVSNSWD